MTETRAERVTGTVFVANRSVDQREAVSAAATSARLVAHPVDSLETITEFYDETHPSCLVTDMPTVAEEKPDLMPALQKNGLELPVELAEEGADSHTLVISASLLKELECVLQKGSVVFLRRPYTRGQLLSAIDRAIELDQAYQQQEAQRRELTDRAAGLTDRQREVMRMLYNGLANKVIAKQLDVSIRTVESDRAEVLRIMRADTVVDLTRMLAESGYFREPG